MGLLTGYSRNFLLIFLLACRAGGRSNVDDFTLAAEACLPIICAILAEIKKKTYPQNCFLNVDVPTDVMNHKVIFGSALAVIFFVGFHSYNL